TYWNKLGEGTEIESPIPIPIPSDLFLDAGNYTVSNTAAGKDVGTFSARLDLSSPFEWLNRESFGEGGSLAVGIFRVIPRSADLLITWRGGSAGSLVVMSGVSVAENQSGGFFLCLEEASKGRFAVPSLVLQALPSADPNKGESGIIYVANSVSGSHFDAAGLDLGMIEFTNTTIRLAAYR
ncbi:MAG: hypothetical protein HY235_00105, partial [Acidobacteria bacterium]|nr:hypothetical protein [Acidobacteriota bacterium]